MNILHINVRSCRYKKDLIFDLLSNTSKSNNSNDVHILIFSKRLKLSEAFELPGFVAYHSVRKNGRGGGVSIHILKTLLTNEVLNLENNNSNFLIIEILKLNIKIFGFYNPGSDTPFFLTNFDNILSLYKNMIIGGDANLNLLDNSNENVVMYKNIVQTNGFLILNLEDKRWPTRLSNTISTVIDHFITDILKFKFYFNSKSFLCL